MNITHRSNRNGDPRRIEKRARTGAAQDAEALISNGQSESQSASDDSYETIVTLEMESCLPTRDRPDSVRGILLADAGHYYRVRDALGAIWMLPKRKWKIVKMEVIKE